MTCPFVTWMSRSPSLSKSKSFVPKPRGMKPDPSPAFVVTSSKTPGGDCAERVQLFGKIGDEDVRKTIRINVCAVRSHAGLRLSVAVESTPGGIIRPTIGVATSGEKIRDHVAGDKCPCRRSRSKSQNDFNPSRLDWQSPPA